LQGVTRVVLTDHAAYEHGLCENLSALVVDLQNQKKFSHIVTAATAFGKNFLPYTGAKLDTNPVGDVTKILSADTFVRPIYAGFHFLYNLRC
jgi:electron transfer flavoprotein alpha subunit